MQIIILDNTISVSVLFLCYAVTSKKVAIWQKIRRNWVVIDFERWISGAQ
jgi:hypothetical protein